VFRHFRNVCLVALAIGALLVSAAMPVAADPISDKRAQAVALQAQIEATNQKVTELGEAFNAAQLRLDQAEADLAAVQAQIDATKAEVARMKGLVADRAAAVYKRASSGGSTDSLDVGNAQQFATREHYAATQADNDNKLIAQLGVAKDQLRDQRRTAKAARNAAAAEHEKVATTKAAVEAVAAQQQQLLAQVQGDIKRLIQEDLARKQAQAVAMARGRYGNNVEAYPNLPPPGPSTVQAIKYAYQQIGKTYVYAGTGPDHYDCSGLVMMAFRSAGVYLPHYSGAQYQMLPHVPLDGMQRGDLLFWGAAGSSHVAIYLGDGQIIESGGTGHDTHVGPIWGHPSGAARVTQ
jgi:cell wall-associated NlpC family hydrolase